MADTIGSSVNDWVYAYQRFPQRYPLESELETKGLLKSRAIKSLLFVEEKLREVVQKDPMGEELDEDLDMEEDSDDMEVDSYDSFEDSDDTGADPDCNEYGTGKKRCWKFGDPRPLQEKYWWLEQVWSYWRYNLPKGILTMAFDSWRSHPQWYLHPILRDACAMSGGCCGRACGCCVHRPISSRRQLGRGHCTINCKCCQEAHAQGSAFERNLASLSFDESISQTEVYRELIASVSMYGILPQDEEDLTLKWNNAGCHDVMNMGKWTDWMMS